MTRNFPHKANVHTNSNRRRQFPLYPKERVEQMLREIAFVLKMTKQVNDEIQAEEESLEPVSR